MSPAIRTLIVDDEPHARAGIRRLLEKAADIEIIGEAANGREAVGAIREGRPDLVLLDVQMPGASGFDVIRAVGPDAMPHVIFITAFDEFALHAFEVNALDYVLKPFTDRRLLEAIQRARTSLEDREYRELGRRLLGLVRATSSTPAAPAIQAPAAPSHIAVKEGDRVLLVRTADIDWIEAASYYVRLHAGRASHLLRETLNALERRLDPALFTRVHRSAIVNLTRIRELRHAPGGQYSLVLESGLELAVARSRWQLLVAQIRSNEAGAQLE